MFERIPKLGILVAAAVVSACAASDGTNVSHVDDLTVADVGSTAIADVAAVSNGPAAPVGIVAEPMDGALIVSWGVKPGVTPEGFLVYYRVGLPGPPWDGLGALAGPSPVFVTNSTTVTLAGLKNGTTYYIAVAAIVFGQQGSLSGVVKATPTRSMGAQMLVDAGVFTMGASPGVQGPEEEPAHPIYLDAFWMDRYVATNAQFRACVEANACDPPAKTTGYIKDLTFVADYFENPLYDDYPVVFLEYENAEDYCSWRGMRLPTEAEWEKAARGPNGDPLSYPWGSTELTCNVANFNNDGVFCVGGTVPVGTFGNNISPYGVIEMSGNVWQWTGDWYHPDYYKNSPCKNPSGPETGFHKVLRGGAWYYPKYGLGLTYRNHWSAGDFDFHGDEFGDYRGFGVRCVREAVGVPCDPTKGLCELPESCLAAVDAGGDTAQDDSSVVDARGEETKLDGGDTAEPECFVPEYVTSDPVECLTPMTEPLCPSGLAMCPTGSCACAIGATADPGTCGESALAVTLGWNDVTASFKAYSDDESVEICQGLQGGIHILVALTVAVPGVTTDIYEAHVFGTLKIDGVLAGVLRQSPTQKFKKVADGVYNLKPKEVRLEGCLGAQYAGKKVTLDVLVRDKEDRWGTASVKLLLKDDVVGPWYDVLEQHNCTGF